VFLSVILCVWQIKTTGNDLERFLKNYLSCYVLVTECLCKSPLSLTRVSVEALPWRPFIRHYLSSPASRFWWLDVKRQQQQQDYYDHLTREGTRALGEQGPSRCVYSVGRGLWTQWPRTTSCWLYSHAPLSARAHSKNKTHTKYIWAHTYTHPVRQTP
jgi:hypothetical protein